MSIITTKLQALASNIRGARLKRNYSQEYLALRLGISQNGYSKIELGYTKISFERILEIADILEIDASQLTTFDMDAQVENIMR